MARVMTLCFAATVLTVTASYSAVGQASGESSQESDSLTGSGFFGIQPDDFSNRNLLSCPAVQAELELSNTQRDRLKQVYRTLARDFIPPRTREWNRDPEGVEATWRNEIAAAQEEIARILTPAQNTRVTQLALRAEGVFAILRPEVADKLNLSFGQIERATDVIERMRGARRHFARRSRAGTQRFLLRSVSARGE